MIKKLIFYLMTGIILMAGSCKDPWEDRFESSAVPDKSIWEIVSGTPEYSGFLQLLEETGFDTVVQRNTPFTVFVVPNNNFPDLSAYTADEKKQIAAYHLSNFVLYNEGMDDKVSIKTLQGKRLVFSVNGPLVKVNDDAEVLHPNIIALNGVMHEINNVQLVRPNLFQYIQNKPEYSYMTDFFAEGTELIFDIENSVPVGINDEGQTIYDTVWKQSNDFLSTIADISSEDKQYTMFLANNTMLDTISGGDFKFGYLSNLGSFIIDKIIYENELPGSFNTVTGFDLLINSGNYTLSTKLSNAWVYTISGFDGVRIPKSLQWEITDVSDFDSVRNVKATEYVGIYDQLSDILVTDVDGSFVNLKYEIGPGPLNNDYLKIVTEAGTNANVTIKLPDLLPGKYAIKMTAQIRVVDGLQFDVLVNGEKIGTKISLNGGTYNWAPVELGEAIVTTEKGNEITLSILGDNRAYTKGYLDYFNFEPVK